MAYQRISDVAPLCYIAGPCSLCILCSPVHMLIPYPQQSLSHPLSSWETTSLFFMSVSLFLLCGYVLLCRILNSMQKFYRMVFVSFWLVWWSLGQSMLLHSLAVLFANIFSHHSVCCLLVLSVVSFAECWCITLIVCKYWTILASLK